MTLNPINCYQWLIVVLLFCASATFSAEAQVKATGFASPLKPGEIVEQSPPNDPLLSLSVPANFPNYQFTYSKNIPLEKGTSPVFWQHFITLRNAKADSQPTNGLPTGDAKTRLFDVASPFWLFSPQFSPNGDAISLKVGDPFGGYYGFFLWDLQSQKVEPGPKVPMRFPRLLWSPNSKYIAYVQGGDAGGNTWQPNQNVDLYVFEVESGTSSLVIQSKSAPDFNWTSNSMLLYSTQKVSATANKPNNSNASNQVTSNIFEYDTTQKKSRLILNGGAQPLASPDGKWMLFKADESFIKASNIDKEVKFETISSWYLMNTIEKKYRNFPLSAWSNSDLLWTPDSKTIVELEKSDNGKPAIINTVDVESLKKIIVATVTSQEKTTNKELTGFTLLSITTKGDFIVVAVIDTGELRHDTDLLNTYSFLLAVERKSGTIYRLAEAKNVTGFDFREIE